MAWNYRIMLTVMIGISIAGFCRSQPARSLIPADALDPVIPANAKQPRVQLTVRAFVKVISEDPLTGERKYVYLPLSKGSKVKSGSIIRYVVIAKNGNRPVKNLVVTRPINKMTSYVKNSSKTDINAELLVSNNDGQSYAAEQNIDLQAASTSDYTNLRWRFSGVIPAEAKVQATYEIQVK